jgi:hypothetical protein
MPDLYSTLGAGSSKRVLTSSDSSGPETTWLRVETSNQNWEGGEDAWTTEPTLTTSDSINYQAIVECIQTYCEVYEVVRADYGNLVIKVRHSSVPYVGAERKGDQGFNSTLNTILHAHPDLGEDYTVYNGRFRGYQITRD